MAGDLFSVFCLEYIKSVCQSNYVNVINVPHFKNGLQYFQTQKTVVVILYHFKLVVLLY